MSSPIRPGTGVRPRATTRSAVVQVESSRRRQVQDLLATEEPLEMRVVPHGQPLPGTAVSVTMRTPGHDFELAAGFLYTEGLIPGRQAVRAISYCVSPQDGVQQYNIVNVTLQPGYAFDSGQLQRNFYQTSSCGVCGKASLEALELRLPSQRADDDLRLTAALIQRLPDRLRAEQVLFDQTGGLHGAALFTPDGDTIVLREDVGRHNAVDKVIGHALLAPVDLSRTILMVSGRVSFEIMQKAAVAGIPAVVAVSAPSSLAVEVAEAAGMTLVGFLRPGRFNVYAGAQRVTEE